MSEYTPIDDAQSWSSHDVLFLGASEQERMIEQGGGIAILVLVSITLLFSIINTHKSGAHLMLGFIITGFALCLGHLLRAWRNGDLDPKFKYFILTQMALLMLLCIVANIYFWQ